MSGRRVLCPCCRARHAASVRAAIDVLADPDVDPFDREIANAVAAESLALLRLPSPGEDR
jgi:hypothetical protein